VRSRACLSVSAVMVCTVNALLHFGQKT
jgi:hypothetical protein